MAIAYILEEYPSNTEYFIQEEIRSLEMEGMEIIVFASRGGGEKNNSSKPSSRVVYLSDPGSSFSAAYGWAIRRMWNSSNRAARIKLLMKGILADHLRRIKHIHQAVLLAHEVHRRKCNWMHAHFASFPATLAHLASSVSGLPYSLSAHAHDIHTGKDLHAKLKHAEFVVTCNNFNKQVLVRKAGTNAERKIHTVYHGINISAWPFPEVGHTDNGLVHILCVARLVEKKGIKNLIHAVSILRSEGRPIQCIVIGEGELKKELEEQINALNLTGEVTLMGAQPQSFVARMMRTSQILVLPSTIAPNGDRDGIPNVLIEAMASGLPVITTDVGGISELIKDGVTGFLCRENSSQSVADAIKSVLDNPQAYETIRVKARKCVEADFDIDHATKKLATIFKSAGAWVA